MRPGCRVQCNGHAVRKALPHQVSEAVAPAPPPPGIAAVASRGTALGSTGPDVDAVCPYPEVNPDVAVVSTLPRPASVLADTAHAPKKMINSNVTTIAPTDVSMAKLRLAYDTIARILYSSMRPIDSLPTTIPTPSPLTEEGWDEGEPRASSPNRPGFAETPDPTPAPTADADSPMPARRRTTPTAASSECKRCRP